MRILTDSTGKSTLPTLGINVSGYTKVATPSFS